MFPVSHETKSWGERTTLVAPLVAIQILSENASVAPKAQHEPHYFWSLMAWIQFGHWVLASKEAGALTGVSSSI